MIERCTHHGAIVRVLCDGRVPVRLSSHGQDLQSEMQSWHLNSVNTRTPCSELCADKISVRQWRRAKKVELIGHEEGTMRQGQTMSLGHV